MSFQNDIVKRAIYGALSLACGAFFYTYGRTVLAVIALSNRVTILEQNQLAHDSLIEQDQAYLRSAVAELRRVVIERYPGVVEK